MPVDQRKFLTIWYYRDRRWIKSSSNNFRFHSPLFLYKVTDVLGDSYNFFSFSYDETTKSCIVEFGYNWNECVFWLNGGWSVFNMEKREIFYSRKYKSNAWSNEKSGVWNNDRWLVVRNIPYCIPEVFSPELRTGEIGNNFKGGIVNNSQIPIWSSKLFELFPKKFGAQIVTFQPDWARRWLVSWGKNSIPPICGG